MYPRAVKVAEPSLLAALPDGRALGRALVATGASWLVLNVLYGAVAISFLPWDQTRVHGLFKPLGTFDYFMDFAVLLSALLSAATESRIVSFGLGFCLCLFVGGADISRYAYSGPGDLAAAVQPLESLRFELLFAWWPLTWTLLFVWNRRRIRAPK
jgi:hypothetical protein